VLLGYDTAGRKFPWALLLPFWALLDAFPFALAPNKKKEKLGRESTARPNKSAFPLLRSVPRPMMFVGVGRQSMSGLRDGR